VVHGRVTTLVESDYLPHEIDSRHMVFALALYASDLDRNGVAVGDGCMNDENASSVPILESLGGLRPRMEILSHLEVVFIF
jgi:hypothetical protein